MPKSLFDLEGQLGITFTDRELLQQVFIHRSFLNENRAFPLGHNERLEFLGDAVLELAVTEHLYREYPNPEGELTAWRSALVKGETLAKVAAELQFSEYLHLSRGEEKSGGRSKAYLLANVYEAFVGALYLDQGFGAARGFVARTILSMLPELLEKQLFVDPKSRLQEVSQGRFGRTPTYVVVNEEGPDHEKTFTAEAVVEGRGVLGRGSGNSKQAAQVSAAAAALKAIEALTGTSEGS